MRRVGLGRRGGIGGRDDPGDPLEGIVNLFDIGIVLAAAALIAAAGMSGRAADEASPRTVATPLASPPSGAPRTTGRGEAVGTVYRLEDGRLLYVRERSEPRP
jgi:hypothetical protein